MTARILVVDDIPANVKLLEARLTAVMTSKYSAESRASNSLTLAGTSSTTRTRAVIDGLLQAPLENDGWSR